eukprot:Hpha_TRINITY_DN15105_c2_g1::TRINITY_DN15105_c2_g1_i1::g.126866::m.126866
MGGLTFLAVALTVASGTPNKAHVRAIFNKFDLDGDGHLSYDELFELHGKTIGARENEVYDKESHVDMLEALEAPNPQKGLNLAGLTTLYEMNNMLNQDVQAIFPDGVPPEPVEAVTEEPRAQAPKKEKKKEEKAKKRKRKTPVAEAEDTLEPPKPSVKVDKKGGTMEIHVDSEETLELLKMIQESARKAHFAGSHKEEELDVMLGAVAESTGIDIETLRKMVEIEKRKASGEQPEGDGQCGGD